MVRVLGRTGHLLGRGLHIHGRRRKRLDHILDLGAEIVRQRFDELALLVLRPVLGVVLFLLHLVHADGVLLEHLDRLRHFADLVGPVERRHIDRGIAVRQHPHDLGALAQRPDDPLEDKDDRRGEADQQDHRRYNIGFADRLARCVDLVLIRVHDHRPVKRVHRLDRRLAPDLAVDVVGKRGPLAVAARLRRQRLEIQFQNLRCVGMDDRPAAPVEHEDTAGLADPDGGDEPLVEIIEGDHREQQAGDLAVRDYRGRHGNDRRVRDFTDGRIGQDRLGAPPRREEFAIRQVLAKLAGVGRGDDSAVEVDQADGLVIAVALFGHGQPLVRRAACRATDERVQKRLGVKRIGGPSRHVHAPVGKPARTRCRESLRGLLKLPGDGVLHGRIGADVAKPGQAPEADHQNEHAWNQEFGSQVHGSKSHMRK